MHFTGGFKRQPRFVVKNVSVLLFLVKISNGTGRIGYSIRSSAGLRKCSAMSYAWGLYVVRLGWN